MQAVLDTPMGAGRLSQSFARERLAEKVMSGFSRRLGGCGAGTYHSANGSQTRPLMLLLQGFDIAVDNAGAGLSAAVVAIDDRRFAAPWGLGRSSNWLPSE